MKKPSTSDQLKQALATALHTSPDDWKRGSKSKNEEGLWVREFENKNSGAVVTAIELEDGSFLAKAEGWSKTFKLSGQSGQSAQFSKKAAAPLSQPEIMYGPIANEAADEAIAIIMGDKPRADTDGEDFDGSEWGVPKKLLDDAGKALANRHCFAICAEESDCLTAMITPIRYYKEEGCCSDQSGPVGHLLPKCAEAMESTWECYEKGVKTSADLAKYLQAQGFQWSRDFQNYIDAGQTKALDKQIAAMEDEPSPTEAAQQVMKVVLEGNEEGNDEIPAWLLKKADPKELARNFYFIVYDMRADEGDLVAVVAPKGKGTDDSKKSYSVMYHLFPEVQYIDDCVEGWWAFPANVDTPLKLAQKLVDAGFEYNAEYQDDALKDQLKGLKTPSAGKPDAPKAPGA